MVANLTRLAGNGPEVLVGPETSDDAGVFLHQGTGWVATADFITPVCDEPRRFGRVAAANSLSDVYAMGGRPLFALNLCAFPEDGVSDAALTDILEGGAVALGDANVALLGGHTVHDDELKYGLAVVGTVDPERILTNASARAGDRLVLTKPIGTGVLINAFKSSKVGADLLEDCLVEMERLNDVASAAALEYGAHGATDITGFGLAGHSWEMANGSSVRLRIDFDSLPVHDGFLDLTKKGVTTGSTADNERHVADYITGLDKLDKLQRAVLFDPQTSGGLLVSLPAERASSLVNALRESGHRAADVGEVVEGPAGLEIV